MEEVIKDIYCEFASLFIECLNRKRYGSCLGCPCDKDMYKLLTAGIVLETSCDTDVNIVNYIKSERLIK